jgi:hypothetical protein
MIESLKRWTYRVAMLALVSVLLIGLAYTFPADAALLFAIDLATYVEVAVAVYVAGQVARLKPMLAMARQWLHVAHARIRGRTESRPQMSRRTAPKAANDDEDAAPPLAA